MHWSFAYLEIPFRERGRDRSGVDCWGLVRLIYAERHGIPLPSFDGVYRHTTDTSIGPVIREQAMTWEPVEAPQEGDVAVIPGDRWHIAYCLDATDMLHVRRGTTSHIAAIPDNAEVYRWKS